MNLSFYYELVYIKLQSFLRITRYILEFFSFACRFIATRVRPFYIHLSYFLVISFVGSVLLVTLRPSNPDDYSPRYLDMLFLSTSAVTVSGLSTVQMEDLSSSHIVVLTLLMFAGSEVFVTFLGLMLRRAPTQLLRANKPLDNRVRSVTTVVELEAVDDHANSGIVELHADELALSIRSLSCEDVLLKGDRSARRLGFVVLGYLAITHVLGFLLVFLYITRVPSARAPLAQKGINVALFSASVVVSSCANGGLVPTNENMAVFVKHTPLLLMFAGQILAGNLLFPLFLRLFVWFLWRVTKLRSLEAMVTEPEELLDGTPHLRRKLPTAFLTATAVGLAAAAVALFCSLDWRSPALGGGLSAYQKVVNAFFMAVNARHAGENSVDAGLISPAVLVLFIVMMYLPSSATFAPPTGGDDDEAEDEKVVGPQQRRRGSLVENVAFSQLACNAVFVIVICITERRRLRDDPLNFSMLKIVFEVISAYGNVGLSMGYSCSRLRDLHPESVCDDKPYSFVGWWSDQGKLALAFVMLYGRLKAFTTATGKYWKVA